MKRIANRRANGRGFSLVLALFVLGLVLLGTLTLLSNSIYGSTDTRNIEQKSSVFDAAEAGIEDGLAAVDALPTATGGSGTIANGYAFAYTITTNLTIANKIQSDGINNVTIPPGYALIVSTGTVNGQRPTIAEAIVKCKCSTYTVNNVAIAANGNLTGNWNGKIGIAGSDGSESGGANDANIYVNGTINTAVGFIDGWAKSATGTNSLIGQAAAGSSINAPALQMPTSNDFSNFVSQEKALVGAGNGSTLIYRTTFPGTQTFTCPAGANGGKGCVMFIDAASVSNTGSKPEFDGAWTVVVNGSYSSTGQGGISFDDTSTPASLFAINGSGDIGGNATAAALLWTKTDVTLHGNGNTYGALLAGGNVNLLGGGANGGFQFDKNLNGFNIPIAGHYGITAFGEY